MSAHRSYPADPQGNVLAARRETWALPREVAGVRIPDSSLADDATEFVREVSSPIVFNHAFRSYVIGELMARSRGLTLDSELFYIAAICHDLGQTEAFLGEKRFEIEGADAAVAFLTSHGHIDESRNEVVWDAIAFHTSGELPLRKRPEIALVGLAAVADIIGVDESDAPAGDIAALMSAVPRENMKRDYPRVMTEMARRRPPESTFGGHVADFGAEFIPGFERLVFSKMISASKYD